MSKKEREEEGRGSTTTRSVGEGKGA